MLLSTDYAYLPRYTSLLILSQSQTMRAIGLFLSLQGLDGDPRLYLGNLLHLPINTIDVFLYRLLSFFIQGLCLGFWLLNLYILDLRIKESYILRLEFSYITD
jgi:hypothetical protein